MLLQCVASVLRQGVAGVFLKGVASVLLKRDPKSTTRTNRTRLYAVRGETSLQKRDGFIDNQQVAQGR